MIGNNRSCRNHQCDEGLHLPTATFLCEACFRRQVGDAITEVMIMLAWSYKVGIQDAAKLVPHVEVN